MAAPDPHVASGTEIESRFQPQLGPIWRALGVWAATPAERH